MAETNQPEKRPVRLLKILLENRRAKSSGSTIIDPRKRDTVSAKAPIECRLPPCAPVHAASYPVSKS